METTVRRRKHWGWGYEDQQPTHEEVREAAAGIRSHLGFEPLDAEEPVALSAVELPPPRLEAPASLAGQAPRAAAAAAPRPTARDRKSTRLNSSHQIISYAVFCLKKK